MFRRLFFLWPLCLTVASGADATSILSALKAASGGEHWDQIKTIHVRAAFEQGDLRGTSDTWLDIPHAFSYSDQTVVSPTLGTLHSINGWNGNVSWSADQTGDVWITESEEARRNAFTAAYIDTFGYLFPPRFPVQFTIGPDTAIEVRPSSGVPFDLEIDPASHLIQRIVQTQGVEKPVLALSDYRPAAGVLLPFRQVETRPGSAFTVTTTVTSVEIDVAPPPHIFDPPEPRLTGVEFPPDKDWRGKRDVSDAFTSIGAGHAPVAGHDDPMMHITNTVDYIIVLKGEIYAVMDKGETLLRQGDILIQRGTNHSWHNRSDQPCVIAAVLVSAYPAN